MFSLASGSPREASGPRPAWSRALRRLAGPSVQMRPRRHAVRCEEAPPANPPAADGGSATAAAAAPPPPKEEPALHFEMFNREWSQMSQQDNWDGFRIEAATQVTKWLQASHTLFLGTQLRECGYIYQFGPVFQTESGRTVLVARCGLDGGVTGRVIQKLSSSSELKASSQTHLKDPQRNMHDGSFEYTGKDWTFGAKLAWQGACLGGASFTQRVLPQLQLGGDLTLVAVNNMMAIGQVGARWSEGKDTFTVGVNRQPNPRSPDGTNLHEVRMQYVRRCSERFALGTEFKYSHPDKDSGLSMAYEYSFRNARVQGLLDTDGKVSCSVFDYQGLGFSGMIDYARGDYKFGVLMHVMPPEQQQQQQQPM